MRALRTADRNALAIAAIGLAFVLFLALNILVQATLTLRLDLTEDRRFTLGQGTRDLLTGIDEPIELRLYYSQALGRAAPAYGDHARRVGELLDAYARVSQGRVRVTRFDPLPYSPEEDQAVAEGLRGLPLDADGTLAYFGVVGSNSTDDLETLPFLAPERAPFLEYDLTRMVHSLANPEKAVVGVLGDYPLNGSQFDGFRPAAVTEAIGAFFEVRPLTAPANLDDVDVLLLAQPETLDEPTRYAIDQYVMAGGPVLAFIDPFAEDIARTQRGAGPQVPGTGAIAAMTPLLAAWGVDILAGKVVGDGVSAQRVAAQVRGRQVVADYLPWLGLGPANMDARDAVTANLDLLQVRSAGAIVGREGAETTLVPLVQSSAQAALLELIDIQFVPDPTRLLATFQPSGERYVLAARVTGPVASAFPDGPPEGVDDDGRHRATAAAPLNLILVADADLLADASWVQRQALLGQGFAVPIAANGDFAINALDNLRGGASLSTLRGRGVARRPFEVVEDMRRKAELQYRATEQELLGRIDALEAEIRAIQADEADAGVLLTAAQQQVIDDARGEMLTLRAELRGAQHALRKDVARLETWVRALNIWAVPLLVALFAVGLALNRRRRARHDVAAGLA